MEAQMGHYGPRAERVHMFASQYDNLSVTIHSVIVPLLQRNELNA